MADPESRALFIDESGDAESNLVLTALTLRVATVEAARESTLSMTDMLSDLIPGFRREHELHARRLARPLTPTELAKHPRAEPFKTYQRQFVFLHALYHLSSLPGARVYSTMWRWKGRFNRSGMRGGRRYQHLLARLLEWVQEDPLPISSVFIDRGGQELWYRNALDAAQEACGELWAVNMPDSRDDPLIQLADLAAFAAYQSAIPGQQHSKTFMKTWYREALGPVFAIGGNGYGIRHFTGETMPLPS